MSLLSVSQEELVLAGLRNLLSTLDNHSKLEKVIIAQIIYRPLDVSILCRHKVYMGMGGQGRGDSYLDWNTYDHIKKKVPIMQ